MDSTGTHNGYAANSQNSNDIQWSEIFARHEAVLCSHMEMLSLVQGQIAPEIAAFQTVSSMVNKTVQAMTQLKIARKQIMNNKPSNSFSTSTSTSSHPPQTSDTEANTRKKRRRTSQKEPVPAEPENTEEPRSSKRSRDASSQPPPSEEEADVTPTSLGTEDISEEVQRRLKIREEQRKKRETPKKDKRKRDSLASNDGANDAPTRPHKKRAKVSNERKRNSNAEDQVDTSSKKRRKP